ncbi:MAG TPA: lytic transglycosylase domain-containing protein [Acidimicrobiales bacterium]|nr:lytic transglycosylase domain-containing protein [Acidimicrobiales bacterium]
MAWHAPGQPTPQTSGFVQYLEELRAHPARLVVALVATLVAIAVLLIFQPSPGSANALVVAPRARVAPADAASVLRAAAGRCPGLDWRILAGIYTVETRDGRLVQRSSAGAVGPMQFLPSTWAAYATDGDGDGRADPNSLPDAAAGASRLLCANGGNHPSGLSDALYSYNHSWAYVAQVEAAAHRLARGRSPA